MNLFLCIILIIVLLYYIFSWIRVREGLDSKSCEYDETETGGPVTCETPNNFLNQSWKDGSILAFRKSAELEYPASADYQPGDMSDIKNVCKCLGYNSGLPVGKDYLAEAKREMEKSSDGSDEPEDTTPVT